MSRCTSASYEKSSAIQDKTVILQGKYGLSDLEVFLGSYLEEPVYSYIIKTIVIDDSNCLIQTRSAPNWDGGIITLCTCKHQMRSFKTPEEWESGVWVAGFSSIENTGVQALVYLMRVGEAFESFGELWHKSRFLAQDIKALKSASSNPHGDLYEPKEGGNLFEPGTYKNPIIGHDHENCWQDDIVPRYNRPSALLVGEPGLSFRWLEPLLYWWRPGSSKKKMMQGQTLLRMAAWLERLEERRPEGCSQQKGL
jgi:hypothetical protein